jgi:hypothetical protein
MRAHPTERKPPAAPALRPAGLSAQPRDCTMWYMKPVQVSTDVPQAREAVWDFLDVLANHEQFTDHMLRDWRVTGPARGVGARARLTAVAGGLSQALEMEVIEAEPPRRNVERNVSTSGRVMTGTYTLGELPGGGPGSPSRRRG